MLTQAKKKRRKRISVELFASVVKEKKNCLLSLEIRRSSGFDENFPNEIVWFVFFYHGFGINGFKKEVFVDHA